MSVRSIAKQAGVSPATVSLALNNSPLLPEATKRRIRAAAEKAGYRPNGKIAALMAQVRASRLNGANACFGVVSLYESLHPWKENLRWSRVYEAMQRRADELGYHLEPIGLRVPGMTPRRARTIIDARGIQGLLCFGSPELEGEFPAELRPYAIVTLGQSIRTRLHRVVRHYFNDVWSALERVHAEGYGRPGLVLGNYDDARSGHVCASAYLGWCEYRLGPGAALPILRIENVEESSLLGWIRRDEPDALVFVHLPKALTDLETLLKAKRIRVPKDLGIAAVSQILEHTQFSGMQENLRLMGARAVELLASRLVNLDFGFPLQPRIELVESEWIAGRSL